MIICSGAVQFVLFMHVNVHANGQYCSLTKYWITRNVKKKNAHRLVYVHVYL